MGFLGMVGTEVFTADERPENWRQMILRLYPNGDAPLTAIMSKMSSESTDDPTFHWFEKLLATQAGGITGIFTDSGLTTAYTTGGVVGTVLYVQTGTDIATQVRPGHQVLLRDEDDLLKDINAKVLATLVNGADSVITVQLLEADGGPDFLVSSDRMLIVGDINPEGGDMPDSVSYSSTPLDNNTQIFRTPLSITRTARKTKVRDADKYNEMKREALELHGIQMEKNLIYSVPTIKTGGNGKPERTTQGVIHFLRNNGGIEDNYATSTDATAGASWLTGGEDWLNEKLRQLFQYGPRERIAFVGDKTILAIQRLVRNSPQTFYTLTETTKSFGIDVTTWNTPFGKIHMKIHPLFSYEPSNQKSMLIIVPQNMKYRFIDDTKFYADGETQNTGHTRRDSTDEEFLTEAGYEFHHGRTFGFLNGFGDDNTL